MASTRHISLFNSSKNVVAVAACTDEGKPSRIHRRDFTSSKSCCDAILEVPPDCQSPLNSALLLEAPEEDDKIVIDTVTTACDVFHDEDDDAAISTKTAPVPGTEPADEE